MKRSEVERRIARSCTKRSRKETIKRSKTSGGRVRDDYVQVGGGFLPSDACFDHPITSASGSCPRCAREGRRVSGGSGMALHKRRRPRGGHRVPLSTPREGSEGEEVRDHRGLRGRRGRRP